MSSGGLFRYGTSRKTFLLGVDRSPILKALWKQTSGNAINSPSTLPLDMASKAEIYERVAGANSQQPGIQVKAKQGFAYAKELMRFYKHGVKSVWQNNQKVRGLLKHQYKFTKTLDSAGNDASVRIPNFQGLVQNMSQHLYINLMENQAEKRNTTADVVRAGTGTEVTYSEHLFNVSRSEFQLMKRTPPDFLKIPLFVVVFSLFMEMTPVLCYAFPEVTPSTCVLPSILPRIWRAAPGKKLRELVTVENIGNVEDYAMKTAYNLPSAHVSWLAATLRLKTKYIPSFLFPESELRRRLQNHFNYLAVDNYYLSGLNGDGNVWSLSVQELVTACLERNLVADCEELVKSLSTGSLDKRSEVLDELRLKLVRFVADFGSANVGYLAVGHLLESVDPAVAREWRK